MGCVYISNFGILLVVIGVCVCYVYIYVLILYVDDYVVVKELIMKFVRIIDKMTLEIIKNNV